MEFNKNSVLVRISATATGSYSGAEAYGDAFVPLQVYEAHKDELDTLSVYVHDLDGKHSEIEADIDFEEWTMAKLLATNPETHELEKNNCEDNLDEMLLENISYEIGLTEEEESALYEFNEELWKLERFYSYKDIEVTLTKDTVVEGVIVPKGTLIQFRKENEEEIPEDWSFEFEGLSSMLEEMN